jgi:hypothetical protein
VFPIPDVHCEGNVLFQCTYDVVSGRVVANWATTDCALLGQVCRLGPLEAVPSCKTP